MTYRARSIVAAIGLAILAVLLVGFYVTNYKKSVEHSQQNVSVYVAAKDIPAGTSGADLASGGYLKQEQVLRQSVVPGAISSPKDVAKLVADSPTYAGEQVSLSRFSSAATEGLRGLLRGPLRAVQIAGDPNQVLAGTLKTGDHVDLVANVKIGSGVDQKAVDRIVLRNLRVLKAPPTTDSGVRLSSATGTNGTPVLLAVTDTQVQKLFYVVENDDWALELRPVVGATDSPETVETQATVVGDGLGPKQLQIARGG
jgi:Flp pilus assembly protein CpaB